MGKPRASVAWAGVVAWCCGVAACNLISGVGKFSYDGAGSGGAASSTGSNSTGSGGTGGHGCTDAGQCPVPPGPCSLNGTGTCNAGVCGVTYVAGPASTQVYGNCQKNVCDDTAKVTSVADATNVYVSGSDCAVFACADGGLSANSIMAGATCTFMTTPMMVNGLCEANSYGVLACAQCSMASECTGPGPTPKCTQNTCVSMMCGNGTMDNGETDTDCGGPQCVPCGTSKKCIMATDCFSKVCNGAPKQCQPISCNDGVQNGPETDVDCGGGVAGCSPCADNLKCLQDSDCESGVCKPKTPPGPSNVCVAPTCNDGVKNGGESGIDCDGTDVDGGPPCPPCQ